MNLLAIKAIAIAAAVVALFGFGWMQGSDHVQAKWDRERAEMNAKAVEALDAANARVRETETRMANKLQQVSQDYSQRLKEKTDAETAAIDRSMSSGLFINAECPSAGNTVSGTATSAERNHAKARIKLPAEDGAFLIRLAAEADRVAEQLTACQKIIEERK